MPCPEGKVRNRSTGRCRNKSVSRKSRKVKKSRRKSRKESKTRRKRLSKLKLCYPKQPRMPAREIPRKEKCSDYNMLDTNYY